MQVTALPALLSDYLTWKYKLSRICVIRELLCFCILKLLVNEVYMCKQDSPTTVPLQTKFIKSIPFLYTIRKHILVRLPLIPNHLIAGVTSNRYEAHCLFFDIGLDLDNQFNLV